MQARIQDSEGGVSYIRRGGFVHQKGGFRTSEGGVSYRNFRSGSKLLQGPGQINKQKKIADSRRGGFRSPPKKTCIRAWYVYIHLRMHVHMWVYCINICV